MKHWVPIFVLILSILGCQNVERPEKPKNLISKEKMVDVLTEAYLANAARSVNNQAIIDKGIQVDSLIFKKFEVDSVQFAKSNDYYAADINMYLDIFQKVEARLVAMEKKLDSIRDLDRKRNDSVESQQNKERTIAEPKRDSLI
ncbi:DUF4296 domain-containing protein [Aequorivita vladivostokensis]|uniref:DUF4296 domain-containing protein n=1 Tax=Aequorivita vladivostokensis TaxID=171194 RepID=A0ABR5DFW6_9FLAO|nr:DUF4296 domain-containing protein [Aequorivita vladivostokensis]KJJ37655.1 hypothetical protein MB09_12895 [Aequorivita vladivostokensis]MAB56201.1 DUF4296 domain-containing protein [Aequorivita sp.]MBF31582.1 DUF4296 domain-containing protein [Aequorivita sp.]|tara:strand:- start:29148 stop:29579 length:432 start_codon:yes stop_codon:yes gene_type:complete